jgi:hypothetical protein
MTSELTYPKFRSISHLDFELQQKYVKMILIFIQKLATKKYGHALPKL